MPVRINDTAPDFTAETTQGPINFHEWIGDGWAILFSHPKNFTPVRTHRAGQRGRVKWRNLKSAIPRHIGLSVDPVPSHGKWAVDIQETVASRCNYPMIGDTELKQWKLYGYVARRCRADFGRPDAYEICDGWHRLDHLS